MYKRLNVDVSIPDMDFNFTVTKNITKSLRHTEYYSTAL